MPGRGSRDCDESPCIACCSLSAFLEGADCQRDAGACTRWFVSANEHCGASCSPWRLGWRCMPGDYSALSNTPFSNVDPHTERRSWELAGRARLRARSVASGAGAEWSTEPVPPAYQDRQREGLSIAACTLDGRRRAAAGMSSRTCDASPWRRSCARRTGMYDRPRRGSFPARPRAVDAAPGSTRYPTTSRVHDHALPPVICE
jgi:hypothetical protein